MPTKKVYKAYRARLYPTADQAAYFRRMFGCCRVVYNHFLAVRVEAYEARKSDPTVRVPSRFDLCRMLTDYKRERTDATGHAFLRDVDSTALVYEVQHLDDAFLRFFRRVREGGSDVGFPRFKGRGDKASATVAFKKAKDVRPNGVRFAKVGWVKARVWRELEGDPLSCTISLDAAGRWWASVSCKNVPQQWPEPVCEEGAVDLTALDDAACVSGGADAGSADAVAEARRAKERKRKKKLARERRRLARRQAPGPNKKASAGWLEQYERVAKLEAAAADARRTRAGQLTAPVVRTCARVVAEGAGDDLTPEGREVLRQLRYKCAWADRELIEEQ